MMTWLLIGIINAGGIAPSVFFERFPNEASCKIAAAKIRGYMADGVVSVECGQDQKESN